MYQSLDKMRIKVSVLLGKIMQGLLCLRGIPVSTRLRDILQEFPSILSYHSEGSTTHKDRIMNQRTRNIHIRSLMYRKNRLSTFLPIGF